MKTPIFLYPGYGIGPELFIALRPFFKLFDAYVEFHYLNSIQDLWGLNKPYTVLCGPFESEAQQLATLQSLKPSYALTHVPHETPTSTSILAIPIQEKQMQNGVLKDFSIIKSCFDSDQKIVMVQQYQEQPAIWEETMKAWTKLAFTNNQWRFEDANILSFIKHTKYKNTNQVVSSLEGASVLRALYASIHHSLNRSFTYIQAEDGAICMPLHGHAPDIVGMGIANPYALISGFCSLLHASGLVDLSQQVDNQLKNTYYANREQTTPDQKGVLTTEKYVSMLIENIHL